MNIVFFEIGIDWFFRSLKDKNTSLYRNGGSKIIDSQFKAI
jgi:hypothetical protein